MEPALVVHGGAWNIPESKHEAHLEGCRKAAELGGELLLRGQSALDVVERVVCLMEDDPTFDAGRGSFLNIAGEVEMDAMIMDGTTLRFGSVSCVQNLRHPISLARAVMEDGKHCMLTGKGAMRFARQSGMETITSKELLLDRELDRWKQIQLDLTFTSRSIFHNGSRTRGTVGAVAIDERGRLAAATSTGGTPYKMPGRTGDSPLVGCGTYADDETAAVSATGWGESIMRVTLARRICNLVEGGLDAMSAVERSIAYLGERIDGLGGAIAIDKNGAVGFAHNTPYMAMGIWQRGRVEVGIRK